MHVCDAGQGSLLPSCCHAFPHDYHLEFFLRHIDSVQYDRIVDLTEHPDKVSIKTCMIADGISFEFAHRLLVYVCLITAMLLGGGSGSSSSGRPARKTSLLLKITTKGVAPVWGV